MTYEARAQCTVPLPQRNEEIASSYAFGIRSRNDLREGDQLVAPTIFGHKILCPYNPKSLIPLHPLPEQVRDKF
jgi:hypothetical protein